MKRIAKAIRRLFAKKTAKTYNQPIWSFPEMDGKPISLSR